MCSFVLMEHPLYVQNNLSGKKEQFVPINSPFVGMYVCGPTVYSNVHIGNVRTFMSFDVVFRYLQHLGYKVRYVRNITDVGHLTDDADDGEDKIAKQARLDNLEPMEVVQRVLVDFREVMKTYNILPPSIEPSATGHIVEQIAYVEQIVEAGLGYEVNGSVYFDVEKYNSQQSRYGELSGRKIEDLMANTRALDGQDEKRNALDFALWKKADPSHIMRWPSPWGEGFPRWHLECSVMSTRYLGKQFDLHGGGMDLKFPHHECEIAQNVAATGEEQPVRYWLHGNMLTVNGTKMSKSLGNVITPHELISGDNKLLGGKGYEPMAVRLFMLQTHYSSTLDISVEALTAAEKGYKRLSKGMRTLTELQPAATSDFDVAGLQQRCAAAMNDDFNTPVLIGHLFDGVRAINSAKEGTVKLTAEDIAALSALYQRWVFDVLGLQAEAGTADDASLVDGLMGLIINMRKDARARKDWSTSDLIRDELARLEIKVNDGKEGSTWERL